MTVNSGAENSRHLFPHRFGGRKSEIGLAGLKPRCWHRCAPSGGSRGESAPRLFQLPVAVGISTSLNLHLFGHITSSYSVYLVSICLSPKDTLMGFRSPNYMPHHRHTQQQSSFLLVLVSVRPLPLESGPTLVSPHTINSNVN